MQRLLLLSCLLGSTLLSAQTVIFDWESSETTATFQHFGSTLDTQPAPVIDNPDPTGVNTSATVVEFVKPANSEVWAGTFTPMGLEDGLDLTNQNQLCLDIWRSNAGAFTVKLENGANGEANWEQTQSTDVTNEWVTLCYDLTLPGEAAGDAASAVGATYNGMALFNDLGTSFDTDQINYVDNFVVNNVMVASQMIEFAVDMAGFSGTFDTVYVSGSFNGWNGTANPLSDEDGDGVYSATLEIDPGTIEYKFQVDGWTTDEQFGDKFYACTVTDPSGQFTNRQAIISAGTVLNPVCWNSCFACGNAVDITFNIGAGAIAEVDTNGLYIAGGGNFGNPGDFQLDDSDEDGIFTGTFEKQVGFSSFYTITNGACPDYGCKEDISGQDCANPDNFNDRFIAAVSQDTVIATCYGVCTDTADDCGDPMATPDDGMITLSVDVNDIVDADGNAVAVDSVFLAGQYNGWNGAANRMTDDDGDGVYDITVMMTGGSQEYKFVINDNGFEELEEGASCTITTGGFTNRVIMVDGDATIDAVCFGSCDACATNTDDLETIGVQLAVRPTVISSELIVDFGGKALPLGAQLDVVNPLGQVVYTENVGSRVQTRVAVAQLQAGLYFVRLTVDNRQGVVRVLKN